MIGQGPYSAASDIAGTVMWCGIGGAFVVGTSGGVFFAIVNVVGAIAGMLI